MKKSTIAFLMTLGAACYMPACLAINLLGVYKQAQSSDPTFKNARATWLAARENIAISRAGLLPQLTLGGGLSHDWSYTNSDAGSDNFKYNERTYSLSVTEAIFNYELWQTLKQAKASVKSAAATFSSAAEELIYRTAKAYFDVLNAQDTLRYATAEKEAIGRQLDQAREQFKVGLIAITPVYQAQASYDSARASVIQARNAVLNAKESLREITGNYYKSLASLVKSLPLLTPDPRDINQWVKVARDQNYTLLASRYAMYAARENIAEQGAARMPTVTASGGYSYRHSNRATMNGGNYETNLASLGVSVNFPVIQGGGVTAKLNQAKYEYQQAIANWELTDRSTISDARQAYNGVMDAISKVRADRQAVKSNESSLKSTEAAYVVGTSTMVDVLSVQADLYNAQKVLASDQYAYLLKTLALKQAAGTLGVNDLQIINRWLQKENRHVAEHKYAKKAKQLAAKKNIKSPVKARALTELHKGNLHSKVKLIKKNIPTIKQQILEVNPAHYTMQFLVTADPAHLIKFANQKGFPKPAFSYRVKTTHGYVYKLIAGDFVSRNAASAAKSKLPAYLQKIRPWLRTYASVRVEVK
ncbi:MAG: TolC family outer membrane protein [Gammaproteobacteria bacterium]|nr:TolC family outer membrane protein [Gammaproteobacteria bacterium]